MGLGEIEGSVVCTNGLEKKNKLEKKERLTCIRPMFHSAIGEMTPISPNGVWSICEFERSDKVFAVFMNSCA